jgi:NADH-quinone oxidoreductase subunit M
VGLSLAGFALTLRCIESRIGRVLLNEYHGLYEHTPTLAALFLLTGLASIGFPGTVGFIGTELLIEGAVGVFSLIGTTVVIATALNGIAILNAYFRIFTGTHHKASISLRARPSEQIAVLILIALIIGGGLFPQWGVASRYHAAMALIGLRERQASNPNPEPPAAAAGPAFVNVAEQEPTAHALGSLFRASR